MIKILFDLYVIDNQYKIRKFDMTLFILTHISFLRVKY
jgi:hypothetical protein